ncbi:unnamed protein product [Dibothriocephalus latus]|uniref:Homeobox domain-containing protein n=1 Tax=Dibothriocephalus latus TaxID=60516 RepID=A0A3P7LYV0_DIBLA|nr:unnamed protein product [Dibothriocephalus latus]
MNVVECGGGGASGVCPPALEVAVVDGMVTTGEKNALHRSPTTGDLLPCHVFEKEENFSASNLVDYDFESTDHPQSIDTCSLTPMEPNSSRSKRIRTSFTPQQLAILQASFEKEANPDGQELERIAHTACLKQNGLPEQQRLVYDA